MKNNMDDIMFILYYCLYCNDTVHFPMYCKDTVQYITNTKHYGTVQ